MLDMALASERPGWRLRTLGSGDVPQLRRVAQDDLRTAGRELPWPKPSDGADDDGAEEWVADHLAGRRGRIGALGVFDPDGGLHGGVNLLAYDSEQRSLELGVWVLSPPEGRGLVTDACRLALQEVFGRLMVRRVVWRCAPLNARSRAVADRLGFQYERRERSAEAGRGEEAGFDVLQLQAPAASRLGAS